MNELREDEMVTDNNINEITEGKPDVQVHQLQRSGNIPNNEELPMLIYKNAIKTSGDAIASIVENLLSSNNWRNSWRNGIYPYHHYHSNTHEVLVVVSGSAKVQLGGENGITADISDGDVIILPAGTAHKNLGSSGDFQVIGAYPEGKNWDMNTGKEEEFEVARENISKVPIPEEDPIYGKDGPLKQHWK